MLKTLLFMSVLILSSFQSANAQELFSDAKIRFFPQAPTEKSNVIAKISLESPNLCHSYNLQPFEMSGNNLIFKIESEPKRIHCPAPFGSILLEQKVGKLATGVYDARLYYNGEEIDSAKLYVYESEMEVLSTGRYYDEQGDMHIVGDIQNIGTSPVRLVQIDVSFVKEGKVIGKDHVYTTMAVIMPDTTSGFDLLVTNMDLKDTAYFVNIPAYQNVDKPNKEGLRLVVESISNGIVAGKIFNNVKDVMANNVKVVCTFYDYSKTFVLDSVFDYTIPPSIEPGHYADFTIATHNKPIDPNSVVNCNAESSELAVQTIQIVPEFPVTMLILGIGLISALFYKIRRNNRGLVNNP